MGEEQGKALLRDRVLSLPACWAQGLTQAAAALMLFSFPGVHEGLVQTWATSAAKSPTDPKARRRPKGDGQDFLFDLLCPLFP